MKRQRKIIKLPAVTEITGRSRSSILRDVDTGKFPKPIRLSQSSVGWIESEVFEWIDERIADRDGDDAGAAA